MLVVDLLMLSSVNVGARCRLNSDEFQLNCFGVDECDIICCLFNGHNAETLNNKHLNKFD